MGFLNWIILSINIYYFFVSLHHGSASTDVLKPGDQLNYSSALVSSNGNFALGFSQFVPSSNSTYLGIWHTFNNQNQTVWIANRNMPILKDLDGLVLKMDDLGTLKVVNSSGITLFNIFYNQQQHQVGYSGNNTRAVLEDSGNFVVYDRLNRTLWQSFDYPVDILISGMKLGYKMATNQNWTLNSWLSDQDPGSAGDFSMSSEQYQNSPQLLIYRRGVRYWASGPWKDGTFRFLDSFYSATDLPTYYFSLNSDLSGMSVTLQTSEYRLRLNPDGQIDDGSNTANVSTTKFCYGYPSDDNGCLVYAFPECRDRRDSFQWKTGNWIGGQSISDDNSTINLNECMERCWNKCDCVGFMSHSDGVGCTTWINDDKPIQFVEDPSGSEQKFVLVSLPDSHQPWEMKPWALILFILAIVLVSILPVYWGYMRIRRRRHEVKEKRRRDDNIHQLIGSDSFNYGDELEKDIKDAPNVKVFSLKAILTATNNFSNENKLGYGGYGSVYKGKLSDGREIAVKRLSVTSIEGVGEFKNELLLITKLQHTNLVRLYGCCVHQEEKMLVYEFMPNKSLDFFLFGDDHKEKLDWQIRFNIIHGVAQGMLYLHNYFRMKVIHRDLKVSHVLLDENMNPKITDLE